MMCRFKTIKYGGGTWLLAEAVTEQGEFSNVELTQNKTWANIVSIL